MKLSGGKFKSMVEHKEWKQIKNYLSSSHASEAADLFKNISPETRLQIFKLLSKRFSAKVFSYLDQDEKESLLKLLNTEEIKFLLAEMSPDDRTEVFEELHPDTSKKIFKLLSPEDFKETRDLLGYPRESVGRAMTPDYVSIRPDWTVKESLDRIRKVAVKSETVDIIYITDDKGRLLDEIKLHKLILADLNTKVGDIKNESQLIKILATDDQEKAVEKIKKYNRIALPVVDSNNILLGIVTVDDLMDVAEEETTEDFHKIAGVSSHAGDAPTLGNILDAPINFLYKRRVSWLFILIFVNIFSGAIVANFEDLISNVVKLVFFLPVLIASGGNAGSQAATLMVRALSTGDVQISDWFKIIAKELAVSGLLGLTMAVGIGVLGFFRGGWELIAVVVSSMFFIVILGSLIGTALPFILTKLNKDPAAASAPLVTSIADISGVLVYFTIANFFLG